MVFRKTTIAHDKGKPVARWGRKAVSLSRKEDEMGNSPSGFLFPLEIVWLPKAVGESCNSKTLSMGMRLLS
jgi:hypothetical protein